MSTPSWLRVAPWVVAGCLCAGCHPTAPQPGNAPAPTKAAAPLEAKQETIAWYGLSAHPYVTLVQTGVEGFEKDSGTAVYKTTGQQPTQDEESANIEALSTKGYKGFAIYPADAAGANGLFAALTKRGQFVVAYGAEPVEGTSASFTVATDIPRAAKQACEELIRAMGDKGAILNVLESVTDPNTKKRDDGIKEVVAKHPNVHIEQTISDMMQQTEAVNKIQGALASLGDKVDGIICTGYNPTVAAVGVLKEWHKDPKHKRIHFIGIDTDPTVLDAIRDGAIEATIAQNPYGHGYVACAALKLLIDGWTPRNGYQFIEAGSWVVTKANVDTFDAQVKEHTRQIADELKTKYLQPPAGSNAAK
jgi:ribose transport system substrate-binding protein